MLHDISPDRYNNDFAFVEAAPEDKLIIYRGKGVLVHVDGDELSVPTFADFGFDPKTVGQTHLPIIMGEEGETCERADLHDDASGERFRYIYLFAVGDEAYFMAELSDHAIDRIMGKPGWEFIPLAQLVNYRPKRIRFGLMVGYEYWTWYESSQYCGRCGAKTEHDALERMMRCPECGLMIFPKLFPAVIIGITRPDGKVLVTRYANRPYANYALVAGFCEMGETVEQTVHREVMEEVGLQVKNLRYYKSQPWPDSSSLLFGFFCELDGSPEIDLDEHELAMAQWMDRDELLTDNDHSLTREMMGVLREGRETDYCVVEA